jgi:hypothetical protein
VSHCLSTPRFLDSLFRHHEAEWPALAAWIEESIAMADASVV